MFVVTCHWGDNTTTSNRSEIRENYPSIPVIIVTSSDKTELAVKCFKTGIFDYMTKPEEKVKRTPNYYSEKEQNFP